MPHAKTAAVQPAANPHQASGQHHAASSGGSR
jgi:hypothetical protein